MMQNFKYIFKLTNGETLLVGPHDARRVMDRRGEWENPQVVWEICQESIWVRYWPEEIVEWRQEAL